MKTAKLISVITGVLIVLSAAAAWAVPSSYSTKEYVDGTLSVSPLEPTATLSSAEVEMRDDGSFLLTLYSDRGRDVLTGWWDDLNRTTASIDITDGVYDGDRGAGVAVFSGNRLRQIKLSGGYGDDYWRVTVYFDDKRDEVRWNINLDIIIGPSDPFYHRYRRYRLDRDHRNIPVRANYPIRPIRRDRYDDHNRPGDRPERPDVRPGNRPGDRPTRPDVRPGDRPGNRPSRPDVRPDRPSDRPTRPDVRPDRPGDRPSRPDVRPGDRPDRQDVKPDRPKDNQPAFVKPERKEEPANRPVVISPGDRSDRTDNGGRPSRVEERKQPEVRPNRPEERKQPEVRPERPAEQKQPEARSNRDNENKKRDVPLDKKQDKDEKNDRPSRR